VNSSALTATLFGASLACGVIAYQRVRRYAYRWPRTAAVAMRLMFGVGVFMSVWTCSTDVLWRLGIPLRIGAIERGLMTETWWTGPVCLAWSVWIYWELRRNSNVGAPR
jgi:hypothetical protein